MPWCTISSIPELLNLQEVKGEAQPYQVRQLLQLVERHNLADIPDLRHCSAFGATAEDALAEVLKAKEAWLKTAKAARKPIPPPSFRPAIYQVA